MIKYKIDNQPSIKNTVYGNNIDKTKTNYKNENETDYENFKNVDLKLITYNNILLTHPH